MGSEMCIRDRFISICKTPDWHEVTVYEMTTWETTGMLLPEVSALLDVIKLVQLRDADPEGRIVVISKYISSLHISKT